MQFWLLEWGRRAGEDGMSVIDALHVGAAVVGQVDELVTGERDKADVRCSGS